MWSNDIKFKYMFMFPLKNLARKELTCVGVSEVPHLLIRHSRWLRLAGNHWIINVMPIKYRNSCEDMKAIITIRYGISRLQWTDINMYLLCIGSVLMDYNLERRNQFGHTYITYTIYEVYGPVHGGVVVWLPGFAISWQHLHYPAHMQPFDWQYR